MCDPRDYTVGAMLDEIRITYASVVRAVQLHNYPLQSSCSKPDVKLIACLIEGRHIIMLVCEGYSMSILFNDHGFPQCLLEDNSDKTLLEAFGKNIKRLDSKVSVFYEELKIFNNRYQQLDKKAQDELFGI